MERMRSTPSSPQSSWSARVRPASYVIAPDGKVAYSYLGAIDWNAPQVKGRLERLMPR